MSHIGDVQRHPVGRHPADDSLLVYFDPRFPHSVSQVAARCFDVELFTLLINQQDGIVVIAKGPL